MEADTQTAFEIYREIIKDNIDYDILMIVEVKNLGYLEEEKQVFLWKMEKELLKQGYFLYNE